MAAAQRGLFTPSGRGWWGDMAGNSRFATSASWLLPFLVTLTGGLLRLPPLLANYPLHRDEALYGAWARQIASGADPLLLTAWVDKPPLVLYALAGSLRWFGVSTFSLRLPGMLASIIAVPVVYGLGRQIYGERTAFLAAVLFAASPFAILFAPTAFVDSWLALWLATAAWAALARQPFLAGVAAGMAVASKQQGVLVIPLMIALLLVANPHSHQQHLSARARSVTHARVRLQQLLMVLAGFTLVFGPVQFWDSLRWATRPSFWDLGLTTYGGLSLAPPVIWPDRLREWGEQLGYLFGAPAATIAAALLALAAIIASARPWLEARRLNLRASLERDARADLVIVLYIAGYLALHFFFEVQPWDRYLLPLVPLICLLTARGLVWLESLPARTSRKVRLRAILFLTCLLLGDGALKGVSGGLPVGSDHGAYAGLDRVVATLRGQPADAVFYHRWLGWHYDFYLFDAPQERRWWGNGWKLADDAAATASAEPGRAQWVVLPAWEEAAASEIRLALSGRGLVLAERTQIRRPDGSRSFTVYEIAPGEEAAGP